MVLLASGSPDIRSGWGLEVIQVWLTLLTRTLVIGPSPTGPDPLAGDLTNAT